MRHGFRSRRRTSWWRRSQEPEEDQAAHCDAHRGVQAEEQDRHQDQGDGDEEAVEVSPAGGWFIAQTNKLALDDAPASRPVPAQTRTTRVRELALRAKAAIKGHVDVPLELRQALDLLEIETRDA